MSTPFLSEIKIMSFNFPPKGWALCNGQTLPINQNQALFSLLGTTYGGNGQTTFQLPNLQGLVPIHQGSGHTLGERAGQEAHTITISELPAHVHVAQGTTADATTSTPTNATFIAVPPQAIGSIYGNPPNTAMHPATVGLVGGSQAHTNMMPFLTLNFCIALQGIFPSQT